ncbi:MAG: hypothetical protein V7K72_16905 [Nostoc sp.]|uniref:hypothetical protein n=1 Tax=Nostoc sp. TaxID=1180 RepID=UPI002FF566FE
MVNDKEVFRANTLMRCDRFICTHYKDGTLPVQEAGGHSDDDPSRLRTNIVVAFAAQSWMNTES